MTIGAVLLHPRENVSGNLLWAGELPVPEASALRAGLDSLASKGYQVSPFPEGDGVTFSKAEGSYGPKEALTDFREAFPFLAIDTLADGEGVSAALARLAGEETVKCRYLAPVQGLQLDARFDLGMTRFHPPVDGYENPLSSHQWEELCDEAGADVDPTWAPGQGATGTTELLGYTLIEREIEVPLKTLYAARTSYDAQTPLLRLILEDADHALDPIRFEACNYRRLHYLPAKPGWIGDVAIIYLMPDSPAQPAQLIEGRPYVLRVHNNWLGLEFDASTSDAGELAAIVDSKDQGEIALALKAALRAWNRSFYLVELEASFLHLVYAMDALCGPGHLGGDRHRVWISAFVAGGNASRFASTLIEFNELYRVRNRIVHHGQTFADLDLVGEKQCQLMLSLLGHCIQTFSREGFASRAAAINYAFDFLTSSAASAAIANAPSVKIDKPLSADKDFLKHVGRWKGQS